MAPPTEQQLIAQVKKLAKKLDQRASRHRLLGSYVEGPAPFPPAIRMAKMTKAYRLLMPIAEAPWGGLVVESALDRLEIAGIRSQDKHAADIAWGVWQDNKMDSGHKLGHDSALLSGRAFALVWPDEDGNPEISLDSAEQMVVEYQEGSRHKRVAALRRWVDEDDVVYATLYRSEGIYKFQQPKADDYDGPDWARRTVTNPDGEEEPWPVENPFKTVPVVEVRANPRLKAGCWGHARGEFEHCLGVIDRIHLLTFLGLVVAFWLGFPLRGVIGDKILRDDDGQPIAPFDADPGTIAQLENPNAEIFEYKAADRDNLSIFAELAQFAALTKTPRHYFPLAQAMANLSADAIRADEGALAAKTTNHKAFMGEDWEEVFRLCGLMSEEEADIGPRAEVVWKDHESRSLAERADAAAKLAPVLPWQALGEKVLNLTQDEISRIAAMRAADGFGQLVAAAQAGAGAGTGPAGTTPAPPPGNAPPV